MLNLSKEFTERNIKVDILVCKLSGALSQQIPNHINVIQLNKHNRLNLLFVLLKLPIQDWPAIFKLTLGRTPKSFKRILSLKKYILSSKPDILLSCLNSANITSLWVKHLSHTDTIFAIQQVNLLSKSISDGKSLFEIKILPSLVKRWYKHADRIIAISKAVQTDLISNFELSKNSITTIYNPLDLDQITYLSSLPVQEPWFNDKTPVVLAAGRLNKVKDYPFLFNAIKEANKCRVVKLIVLGEGPEKENLEKLIIKLRLEKLVKILDYTPNPYQYMRHADIFALSSKSEGLANVLQEALACGCKIVSTDCPGGPKEILDNGKYGKLVPPNNVAAMAVAITKSIDEKIDRNLLYSRASDFSLKKISCEYLKLFQT